MSGKQLPLILYEPDGTRKTVGVFELEGDTLSGIITDEHLIQSINKLHNGAFSISPEPINPPR